MCCFVPSPSDRSSPLSQAAAVLAELSTAPFPLVLRPALPPSPLQSCLAASQPPLGSGSWPELSRAVPRRGAGDCRDQSRARDCSSGSARGRPSSSTQECRWPCLADCLGPALHAREHFPPPRPPRRGAGRSPGCQPAVLAPAPPLSPKPQSYRGALPRAPVLQEMNGGCASPALRAPLPPALSKAAALPNGEGQEGKPHKQVRCVPAENKVKQQPAASWQPRCRLPAATAPLPGLPTPPRDAAPQARSDGEAERVSQRKVPSCLQQVTRSCREGGAAARCLLALQFCLSSPQHLFAVGAGAV